MLKGSLVGAADARLEWEWRKRTLFRGRDGPFLAAVGKEFLCRRRRRRAKVKLAAGANRVTLIVTDRGNKTNLSSVPG